MFASMFGFFPSSFLLLFISQLTRTASTTVGETVIERERDRERERCCALLCCCGYHLRVGMTRSWVHAFLSTIFRCSKVNYLKMMAHMIHGFAHPYSLFLLLLGVQSRPTLSSIFPNEQ